MIIKYKNVTRKLIPADFATRILFQKGFERFVINNKGEWIEFSGDNFYYSTMGHLCCKMIKNNQWCLIGLHEPKLPPHVLEFELNKTITKQLTKST